jgi:metal-dependent hydrolase (beta-lactamase superfamily II)
VLGITLENRDKLAAEMHKYEHFLATLGQLTKSLHNAGYKPEQIDAVLITRIHPDHTVGILPRHYTDCQPWSYARPFILYAGKFLLKSKAKSLENRGFYAF